MPEQQDTPSSEKLRLEDYIDTKQLENLLGDMAEEFQTGMGLLGWKSGGNGLSLYPIVPEINFRRFCTIVRESEAGRARCSASDCTCARLALSGQYESECHAGLLDMAVPVRIKDTVVAFLYAGQLRQRDIDLAQLAQLKSRHEEYGIYESTRNIRGSGVTYEEFLYHFLSIPRRPREEVQRIAKRLQHLADTISGFNQYAHYLLSVQKLGERLVPVRDLGKGLRDVGQAIKNIFSSTAGPVEPITLSIWSITEDDHTKILEPQLVEWGSQCPTRDGLKYCIPDDNNHPLCAPISPPFELVCRNQRQRTAFRPTAYFQELGSCLVVPIMSEGSPLGVVQIGHARENAFGSVEASLMRALAGIVASLMRRCNEFKVLAEVAKADSRDAVARFAIAHAPILTMGAKAMVFFWNALGDKLEPAFPDLLDSGVAQQKHYLPGMGLTGWVGEYGLALNINDRDEKTLRDLFEQKLRPALRTRGWTDDEINQVKPPVWREITRERVVHTSRPSRDRPLLLVPIPSMSDRRHPRPLGVLRVTDKTQGYFTDDDQKVLESFAQLISLCHDRDRNRSRFVERALYCLWPTVSAIADRADRLAKGRPQRGDFDQIDSLIQDLYSFLDTLAYNYLGEKFVGPAADIDLNSFITKLSQPLLTFLECMFDKPLPKVEEMVVRDPAEPKVRTNQKLLHIALLHLIHNAFKWCTSAPAGLRVGVMKYDDQPAVYVSDDGPGIKEDDLLKVGNPFQQFGGEQGPVARGLGVGLWATREIVMGDLRGTLLLETKTRDMKQPLLRRFGTAGVSVAQSPMLKTPSGTVAVIVLHSFDPDVAKQPLVEVRI